MSDFDAERVRVALAHEQMILDALNDAYSRNRLHHLDFSPAFDVTTSRMAALSWHLPEMATDASPATPPQDKDA